MYIKQPLEVPLLFNIAIYFPVCVKDKQAQSQGKPKPGGGLKTAYAKDILIGNELPLQIGWNFFPDLKFS